MGNKTKTTIIIISSIFVMIFSAVLFKSFFSTNSINKTKVYKPLKNKDNENSKEKQQKQLYTCPMHPQIIENHPGTCPICGMDLVKKISKKTDKELNVVTINPSVVQNMGIKTFTVKKGDIVKKIRSFGSAYIPDNQKKILNLRFSGWVEKVWHNKTGEFIKKGTPLFAIYSPEALIAQKEFLLALNNFGKDNNITKSARLKLKLLGISEILIKKISKENKTQKLVVVYSPFSGYIKRTSVKSGINVQKGKNLYEFFSIRPIWIKAEIYNSDLPFIKIGSSVKLMFNDLLIKTREGKISFIYPQNNLKTRTSTVRIVLKNKKNLIKPGMYAIINIIKTLKNKIIVPNNSILYNGDKKIVFIAKKEGHFIAKEVETGFIGDNNFTEITKGLNLNEKVVISGQFLIDSESQMQEAVEKFIKNNEE